MKLSIWAFAISCISMMSCANVNAIDNENATSDTPTPKIEALPIFPGIYSVNEYLPLLEEKRVAIVANQTSIIDTMHLADFLLGKNINLVKAFCPEHGFRGTADAGQKVDSEVDAKTGLNIVSLYGKNKKPTKEQLSDIDIVVFDLQDVGVRFYTYISTLHYVMEACAESSIPVIILDRPNPNASYIDGPILDTANYRSFIGMHPVPIVYGMTIGEYGQMINGEHWLANGVECELTVIPCKHYRHDRKYTLPRRPSPNLPNARSIELYPTLCLFEATCLSVGRGTDMQFQVIGHPDYKNTIENAFSFTPKPNEGASNPVLNGQECFGYDLTKDNAIFNWEDKLVNISVILKMYELFPDKDKFFSKNNLLEKLVGTKDFRTQVQDGASEDEIRQTWQKGLEDFKVIRNKYLIYN
ncbi:MAG: DUF1343 domain-containing protein [Bacteroidales bacterium]|nr:DUF1343 domain-containing protein [Bacteroidales bacterium]